MANKLKNYIKPRFATEALTKDSTVEEFIDELSKNITIFILTNRGAFSQDDSEAIQEYLEASIIEEVQEKTLQLLQDPSIIDDSDKVSDLEDSNDPKDVEEPIIEEPIDIEQSEDMVPEDILSMLDEE